MKCDRYIGTGFTNGTKDGQVKCTSLVSRPVDNQPDESSTHSGSRVAIETKASTFTKQQQTSFHVSNFVGGHITASKSLTTKQPCITGRNEVLEMGNSSNIKEGGSKENSTRCIVIEMKQSNTNQPRKPECGIANNDRNMKASIREYGVNFIVLRILYIVSNFATKRIQITCRICNVQEYKDVEISIFIIDQW